LALKLRLIVVAVNESHNLSSALRTDCEQR
jgi:hypothetical protein